ncbi:restriction endonuclease subunit S [Streptomyces buecherae]|uniref:restriction endonuclease subunit S n=1 Tax=Streptomyces buecherae TaxID=2763006 RepID=UPI0036B64D5C
MRWCGSSWGGSVTEWRDCTLGDFVSLQRGHDLAASQRVAGGVPVIGSGGITGWHNVAKATGPGIAIGRAANLGSPTLVETDFWPLNTTLYVTDFKGNDVRFTYYLFKSLDLTGFNSGSVQPMLNRNYIQHFPIRVPGANGQRAISNALGALDDKIAVNGRITEAALELARTLYMESSLRDGEQAELGELVELKYGKALREPDRRPGSVPVYGCTGQVGWHDSTLTAAAGAVVGRKGANAGWISWAPRPCWVIDTAFFVGVRKDYLSPEVAFLVLESAKLPGLVGDSAVPGLNREAAYRHSVRVPSKSVVQEISDRARPLMRRSAQAQDESRTLTNLRDTLLPQLMSGKLRVRAAEKIVEDAV